MSARFVVLISGGGTNLQALIDASERGEIPGQIAAVISNQATAYGLERAARAGIPSIILEHRAFTERDAFEQVLAERIEAYNPVLLVLAGFMRILGAAFVTRFPGRILNIHPSLLPHYRGLHTHARALANGDSEHGASVHFVTPELDGGPVALQARVPVLPGDDAACLARRVLAKEHIIYPLAVRWYLEGRLRLRDHRVYIDGHPLSQPLQWPGDVE